MQTADYPTSGHSIECIKLTDAGIATLYDYCVGKNRPVILTDIYDVMPSLKEWSSEFLKRKLGSKTVTVNVSDTGVFNKMQEIRMNFDAYVDVVEAEAGSSTRRMYMQQQSIDYAVPELKDCIEFDGLLPQGKVSTRNLWYGPGGTSTPLHYDPQDNFFMQLLGRKKFFVYGPGDFHRLYPNSAFARFPHLSRVDASNVDIARYPEAEKATKIEIGLAAGNILFLPQYWWHQVLSEETSISINIWCRTKWRPFVPSALHLIPWMLRTQGGHVIFSLMGKLKHSNLV